MKKRELYLNRRFKRFDILSGIVLVVLSFGTALFSYLGDMVGIEAILTIATIMMAIFVAYQSELTNRYILETQKQRLDLEKIKDILFSYIYYLSNNINVNIPPRRLPEPEEYIVDQYIRKSTQEMQSNITLTSGFGHRVIKYINQFLECQKLLELIREYNTLADEVYTDLLSKDLEELKDKVDVIAKKLQEIKSISDKKLEENLLRIIFEGTC